MYVCMYYIYIYIYLFIYLFFALFHFCIKQVNNHVNKLEWTHSHTTQKRILVRDRITFYIYLNSYFIHIQHIGQSHSNLQIDPVINRPT